MNIEIPYDYLQGHCSKSLQLNDINKGLTLCKKLGYHCTTIVLGYKELIDIRGLTYFGAKYEGKELIEKYFNLKIVETNLDSALIFVIEK